MFASSLMHTVHVRALNNISLQACNPNPILSAAGQETHEAEFTSQECAAECVCVCVSVSVREREREREREGG